jgi:hypothetical protein
MTDALYPYGKHLPIFHTPDGPMSHDAAERAAERYMDRADRALLAGQATQEHYDAWCGALDAWVKRHTAPSAGPSEVWHEHQAGRQSITLSRGVRCF